MRSRSLTHPSTGPQVHLMASQQSPVLKISLIINGKTPHRLFFSSEKKDLPSLFRCSARTPTPALPTRRGSRVVIRKELLSYLRLAIRRRRRHCSIIPIGLRGAAEIGRGIVIRARPRRRRVMRLGIDHRRPRPGLRDRRELCLRRVRRWRARCGKLSSGRRLQVMRRRRHDQRCRMLRMIVREPAGQRVMGLRQTGRAARLGRGRLSIDLRQNHPCLSGTAR